MITSALNAWRKYEIPGHLAIVAGNGGLAKLVITSPHSSAELYLHGAHVTHFQLNGQPPLLFLSRQSGFAPGKPIRGGVPICFPWFGNRAGEPSHGFARITEWHLVHTAVAADGTVSVRLALPAQALPGPWHSLRTEFVVTVGAQLTLELVTANESCGESAEIESCLHTYFQVGDIDAVSITGLEGAAYLDFAGTANGERKLQSEPALRIAAETNRTYIDTATTVEIRDARLRRAIRVDKSGSRSTVVWNPWTTQKLPNDFDPAEYRQMVCVESGNVRQNKILLPPGQTTSLRVALCSSVTG